MVSFRAAEGKAIAEAREKSQVAGPPKGFTSSDRGGKGKSLSKKAISDISKATRFAESIGSDKKFSDLAKQYKQYDVKYPDRPPAFRASYGDEVNKVGTPLASTYYKDPVTGEERFFTAQTPTFKQLAGDIGRGLFSGYNTLSYDPNAGGIPITTGGQIVRQQGLLPLLADKAMSGQMGVIGIVKGLYDQAVQKSKDTLDALKKNVLTGKSDIKQETFNLGKEKAPYTWNQVNQEVEEEAQGKTLDLSSLNATQRATYDMLVSKENPLSHEGALAQAKQQFTDNRSLEEKLSDIQQKRYGGIVSLRR